MAPWRRIARWIDNASVVAGKILAWWTLLAVLIITYEVTARYVFDRPTNWAHESMTLLFGMQYILSGAYAHYCKAHVRVDVVYQALSQRNRARIDVLTDLLFFLYLGVMTYTAWFFYWDSQKLLEVSFTDWGPPLYPVKFTVFLGCLLLLLQGFANFIRDLYFAATGSQLT
jgi:TRAP-type mannitol/chloroaromatic compound transport system permease small subunit